MTTLDHDSRSNLEEQFSDAEYDAIYDEIFGQFDSNYTLYESGERSDPASFSVAYDEKLGACYIAFDERKLNSDHEAATDMASPARRVLFGINLRNGELFHNLYDPKLNDMADKNVVIPVLRKILESVPEEKMPNLSKLLDQPSGFPEMEHVLQQLTDTPPISVSSITDGSTVIIRELNEYMVIQSQAC